MQIVRKAMKTLKLQFTKHCFQLFCILQPWLLLLTSILGKPIRPCVLWRVFHVSWEHAVCWRGGEKLQELPWGGRGLFWACVFPARHLLIMLLPWLSRTLGPDWSGVAFIKPPLLLYSWTTTVPKKHEERKQNLGFNFKNLDLVLGVFSSLSDFFCWLISWLLLILEYILLGQPFYFIFWIFEFYFFIQ